MIRAIAVVVLLVAGAVAAGAAEESKTHSTGADLMKICREEGYSFKYGYCMGFIRGVTQMFQIHYGDGVSPQDRVLCIDPGVTDGQVILVVKKYLGEHPESLHQEDILLIANAMHEAFPCPLPKVGSRP